VRASPPEGLLLVDKPQGVTSFDVVRLLRRRLGIRRIGHTGTLDPIAQGLLIMLVGEGTKHQQAFQSHDKVYAASVRLGVQTDTGDTEGQVIREAPVPALDRARVAGVLASLVGPLTQIPPAFSAVKVRGRPSYWWARRRQTVERRERTVRIFSASLEQLTTDHLAFRVHCSAGTYIRTLAELLAERLGTVGHVDALTRERIGEWPLAEARPLAWFEHAAVEDILQQLRPIPPRHASLPSI
jgi:tRNA pseudouridine55 synthase